ncbi:restriction endonuclease [Natrarchaeobius halalkaliphilus]|uniref:site-specific DNA-methyltransferase (adenine-specific) n=2 Tax=Natrarchaeobius halalkaliphilus TaxID=1679091 RepID=A0A3N6LPZ8_9EURY|nr:restriction endonuclease [Natrarchaeobius halalkaliphilus]
MQPSPSYRTNRGLFSDRFEGRLPDTTLWSDVNDDELGRSYDEVRSIWGREREGAPTDGMSELAESLVRPVLETLGLSVVRGESEPPPDRPQRRPTYAVRESTATVDTAAEDDGTGSSFESAVAGVDVRRWGRSLESIGERGDERGFENPARRMVTSLGRLPVRWGILTDGKRWRLYADDAGGRLDTYYEIDLERLLETGDLDDFKYFYCVFRHAIVRSDSGSDPVFERAIDATDGSRELSVEHRERLHEATPAVARAVLEHRGSGESDPRSEPIETDELSAVYDQAVRWLCRLVADGIDWNESQQRSSVHLGDADNSSPGRAGSDGRFTDQLDVDVRRFTGVASIDSRHLGSVYETLLEYRLAVTEQPCVLGDDDCIVYEADGGSEAGDTGENDGEEIEGSDGGVRIEAGTVYLTRDASDRKATGSYYTPDHVVEYVVERTLSPLLEEIGSDLDGTVDSDAAYLDAFVERLLALRILDPAMGCGYFLASAADYLVGELVTLRERVAARSGVGAVDTDRTVDWIRRRIVANCLYGVDLDPTAVEIARLVLRGRTDDDRTSSRALERHLTVGNALVGADLGTFDDLEIEPAATSSSDANAEGATDGRESIEIGEETLRRRLEAVANVRTAQAFDLDAGDDAVDQLLAALTDDEAWRSLVETSWFADAQRLAASERYVHWPLAFPDVFAGSDLATEIDALTPGNEASNGASGFDAVVANPPWVTTAGRGSISAAIDSRLRSYLEAEFETTERQFDLYVAFYERAVRQAGDGRVGFVVPDSILAREGAEPIREYLLENAPPSWIVRIGTAFESAETGAVVLVSGDDTEDVACADASDAEELRSITYEEIPRTVFERQPANRFLLGLDETTRTVLSRVAGHPPLETSVEIGRGEEISKRAPFLRDDPTANARPIAPGSAILEYGIDESELRYVDPDDIEKADRWYRSPKLVFRQTSDSLVGTLDTDGLVTVKSAYTIHLTDDVQQPRETYAHLLGVLTSPLLEYYHYYRHAAYRSVFPQINQSTFEAFPIAMDDGPDSKLVDAVERRLESTAERIEIDSAIETYLGRYDDGPSLGDRRSCRAVAGNGMGERSVGADCGGVGAGDGTSAATMLTATTEELPTLRIGSAHVDRTERGVVVSVTLRYKPGRGTTDGDSVAKCDVDTDRWGYTETEPVPALELAGIDDGMATLVETFVPYAVDTGSGFAGFRETATKTISPLERLEALGVPRLEDVADELAEYRAARERTRELDERIAALDSTIHERVCTLYGVPAEERSIVARGFGPDTGGASDTSERLE